MLGRIIVSKSLLKRQKLILNKENVFEKNNRGDKWLVKSILKLMFYKIFVNFRYSRKFSLWVTIRSLLFCLCLISQLVLFFFGS
jgi:hypothetical protein